MPGTGLQLNNSLGELELNRLGVHALPPGAPLASNMAPTVGRTPDGRVLAIGSPLGLAGTASAWYYVISRHLVSAPIAAIVGGWFCGMKSPSAPGTL